MTENGGPARHVAGRYRLERRIGRGGAGAVWRAHDERLDRPVAVKQIAIAPDAQTSTRGRVLREARAAARLVVPNVVQVYDVIEDDSSAYLIMELVDAPNLNTLVRRGGPLDVEKVAALGLQILDALEAAHRVGIVHRDVKPSNVLIDNDTPRLTDFGIARLGDEPGLTSTGVVMGTPAYIAPEHARGEAVGPAMDLYGLGATMYYAVEGEPPFGSKGTLSTVMAVVSSPPRPMTRAGALTDLLTELLAKDPAARPEADEIRRRLERVLRQPRPRRGLATIAPLSRAGHDEGSNTTPPIAVVPSDEQIEITDEVRPPPDRPPPSEEPVRRDDRRPALFAAAAIVLIIAAISLNMLNGRNGDASSESSERPAAIVPSPEQSQPAEVVDTPSPSPEPTPDPGDGVLPPTDVAIPADWVEYAPEGQPYRLFHPPGWEITNLGGTLTQIRDPETRTYLRLDWVNGRRDPVSAWEQLAPVFASSHNAYEEIGITETTYKGNPAALWEYRYEDGGVALHAYNLGVNAGEYGFALNLQSHEEHEDQLVELWPFFLSAYEFTGP
jgi:serine/threonine protein kinase